ncbi:hypothetical protein MalM14_18240 [Gimesia chilikensis]|nr:hypothetical protein MalM14_18240 [Gimesia chilikensis]
MNVTVDKSTLSQLLQTCLRLVLQATAKLHSFIVQEGMKNIVKCGGFPQRVYVYFLETLKGRLEVLSRPVDQLFCRAGLRQYKNQPRAW